MKIVMIADDSPVIRKVGRRLLEDMNFVVIDAQDSTQVMELCRSNMPDVMILDHDMPGPNTIDVIGQIQQMPDGDACKILYCLSEVMIPEMTKAKRAGANGFLMKPFDRSILEAKFAEAGITYASQAA